MYSVQMYCPRSTGHLYIVQVYYPIYRAHLYSVQMYCPSCSERKLSAIAVSYRVPIEWRGTLHCTASGCGWSYLEWSLNFNLPASQHKSTRPCCTNLPMYIKILITPKLGPKKTVLVIAFRIALIPYGPM